MKGNDRKGNGMYRKQGDRKHRRQVSLAAQWRKRYKHNIDVWHTETAATAPRDIEREAMDDANLMVIVHNSTDRRDKAPKYVRRKHKHAYSEHLGAAHPSPGRTVEPQNIHPPSRKPTHQHP